MTIVIAVVAVALAAWVAWVFNRLVSLRNRLRSAWADVDALLKRRADLVPNLVAAVRGYAGHEQRTLEEVTEARAAVVGAGDDRAARAAAENALTRRVHGLIAIAEAYPAGSPPGITDFQITAPVFLFNAAIVACEPPGVTITTSPSTNVDSA